MFRRALLALLVLCLAIPAVAAPVAHAMPCHEAGMAMPDRHSGHHAPATMPAAHDCIGCAIPLLANPALVAEPLAVRPLLTARHTLLAMRANSGPDSPPPRT